MRAGNHAQTLKTKGRPESRPFIFQIETMLFRGTDTVGSGLREVAWAEDGTVEALEDPDRRFAVGVLWHPEAGEDMKLFEALVAEAKAYREQRA